MNKVFLINGKKYNAVPFDFNTICDLEEAGVSIQEMQKKPMAMLRAYFGICGGLSNEDAGREIQNHVISGGNFNELYKIMGEEMNESDFFQALSKKAKEDATEEDAPKGKKTLA